MMPEARTAQPVLGPEAVSIADSLYGLDCSAQRLPGEYDDNFHLVGADGSAFVLKIMHGARERSFIEMQCSALQHLQKRAPLLALPRVLAAKDGQIISRVTLADGDQRLAWMLTFLPGTILARRRPPSPTPLQTPSPILLELAM